MANPKYKEILKLKKMLENNNIGFEFDDDFINGYQIRKVDGCSDFDVIEHDGSYGREQDKLEIYGLLTDKERKSNSVLGWLTARNVFARIQKARSKNT